MIWFYFLFDMIMLMVSYIAVSDNDIVVFVIIMTTWTLITISRAMNYMEKDGNGL